MKSIINIIIFIFANKHNKKGSNYADINNISIKNLFDDIFILRVLMYYYLAFYNRRLGFVLFCNYGYMVRLGTVHKLCQPYLGGYGPPPLCQWLSAIALPPLPPLSAMSAFGYTPFPSFRRFRTRKISKYIYFKQNKTLLVIHSGSNRE